MQNSTVGQLVPKLLNALEYAVQRSTRMTGGRELKACRLNINNFRGIKVATVLLPKHAVLIGDNNTGKTTFLEVLDLVLGPVRLNHHPPNDEPAFFQGQYLAQLPNADAEAGG